LREVTGEDRAASGIGGLMRAPTAALRLGVVAVVGVIAGLVATFLAPWQFAVLVAWDTAAVVFVVWVWTTVGRYSPAETQEHATREDTNRVSTSLIIVGASVASLVGTGLDLLKASHAHAAGRVALTAIGLVTIALSWVVVHTVFALHYAHEFYTEPVGGIDFKTGDECPDYQDFAYVAFTVGMTFQVSDTDIQTRKIRRTALRHALLAYLFGAIILGVAINLIANLVR
jgi:uncharacterized membrane protein